MLVKFEQIRMVQTARNFEPFDKKKKTKTKTKTKTKQQNKNKTKQKPVVIMTKIEPYRRTEVASVLSLQLPYLSPTCPSGKSFCLLLNRGRKVHRALPTRCCIH